MLVVGFALCWCCSCSCCSGGDFSVFFVFMFVCCLFVRMGWFLDLCAVVGSLGRMGLLVLLTREGLVID
jgi:hypothetical protein